LSSRLYVNAMKPGNVLALFINMALVRTLTRIKSRLASADIEIDEQVCAVVAYGERDLIVLEQLKVLVLLWHGFGRVVMAAHGFFFAAMQKTGGFEWSRGRLH
jgi:hypothetical protein